MAAITESDFKELKELISAQTEHLNVIQKDVTDLRVSNGRIEATLQNQQPLIQKIPDLAEKVGELKNWKQIGLVFITAVISSIFSGTIGGAIGWLIRNGKA